MQALILVLSALAVREIASQCNPTPCGVNTNCQVSGTGVAVCRCQSGWDHAPGKNTIDGCPIRTGGGSSNFRGGSSSSNSLFSSHRSSPSRSSGSTFHQNRLGGGNVATRIEGVTDPCYPDPCGVNTKCTSAGNRAVCACIPGFKGDPYSQCEPAPCDVARCGRNAECVEQRGRAICRCPPGFRGIADVSCDEDPCLGRNTCDVNADCAVITSRNGFPSAQCTCRGEYEGDGHTRCYLDPCKRNPCGINAECQANGEDYRCECPRGYSGNARSRCNPDPCSEGICGPNADCEARGTSAQCSCKRGYVGDPASRQGCRLEPCSQGVCGTGAECTSNGFNAICKCPRGWTGDPYTRCTADPCSLNPCGRNAICSNQGETHKCECPEDHVGSPYDLCTFDPCASNPCGANTACTVRGQRADCACNRGYVGEPFSRSGCRADPCSVADICGPGAECQNSNGRPTCHCLPRYVPNPDPYQGCVQGECVANEDCPSDQACADFNCVDPCAQSCGQGADCDVNNHVAICRCPRGRTGDPFRSCREFTRDEICEKCGANTDCRISDHDPLTPVCSCKSSYIGNPLTGCHRECERDNECSDQQKCEDYRCRAVCDQDACGEGANCRARSHRPDCSCPEFYQGDAYSRAGCRPECTRHNDCSDTQACVEFQCKDPCRYNNPCGSGADCKATGHKAICSCPKGFTGDPFVSCRKFERADLCLPNPCGPGAECTPGFDNNGNDKPVCTCPRGYRGDPLTGCNRGECDRDSDCPSDRGCYNFRCENPCNRRERGQGCGVSAECRVVRHAAVCACPSGTVGDPVVACRPSRDGFRTQHSNSNRFF